MNASETKFQPIIEGTKQYVVPLFQRPYSWKPEHWQVLWDDLIWLCENSEPKSHFIGSIVTMPTTSVPEGVPKYLLIDGQQRLTTIFILLTLIRDRAKSDGFAALAQEIEQTMIVNPFKKENDYFKLLPTQIDRDEYQRLLNGGQPGNGGISQCYSFFERQLKKGKVELATLSNVIITRMSVVSIVLGSEDNPHLVFESLNAKGHPLTQADLIRNYFFMRIHADDQEKVYREYWQPMQEALGENLTEFIRHYLMRNGSIVKQGDVYFTLKDRVGQDDALTHLKEIATFAVYYERMISSSSEPNLDIRAALSRIRRLEITTAYPFLLNCYHDHVQGRLIAEEFRKILNYLENFIIRRFVCNLQSNQLNKMFPQLYTQAQLKAPGNLSEGVRLTLQSKGYPKDTEFRSQLVGSRMYGGGDRRTKTKLILETFESSFGHKEQVPFDTLSIEHVMPQTLNNWWQNHLGNEWQEDHELSLHTLGNLTLTGYNGELSNADFKAKKNILLQSHLDMNKYFEEVSVWNRDEIEKRSGILSDLALAKWPYFGDEDTTRTNEVAQLIADNVTGKTPKIVRFLGQSFTVTSWRDVLEKTLNTIAELEPDAFTTLTQEYPRFISKDANSLRKSKVLNNGYFIEVHLSAKSIYRFCLQALESVGLSTDDWEVEAAN
jgi:uncharacterized protein with ParB-like and HNH nuclease domain